MGRSVKVYSYSGRINEVPKTLNLLTTLNCNLITESVTDLSITIELNDFPQFNYFEIGIDARPKYYFVDSYEISKDLYIVRGTLDVLNTYWNDFKSGNYVVERSAYFNPALYDTIYEDADWVVPKNITLSTYKSSLNPFKYDIGMRNKNYTIACYSPGVAFNYTAGYTPILTHNSYVDVYALDAISMRMIANRLVNPDFWDTVGQVFDGDPTKFIVSIHQYPFILKDNGKVLDDTSGDDYLNLGSTVIRKNDEEVDDLRVKPINDLQILDCGYINVPRVTRDFRDYPPYTTAHLWLPFYGTVNVDLSLYKETNRIYIRYLVEPITGSTLILLSDSDFNINPKIIDLYSGTIGSEVPIFSSNATEVTANILQAASSAIFSAAMAYGNYITATSGAIASAKEAVKQAKTLTGKGSRKAKWIAKGQLAGAKEAMRERAVSDTFTEVGLAAESVVSATLTPRTATFAGGLTGNPWGEITENPTLYVTSPKTDSLFDQWQRENYGSLVMRKVNDLDAIDGFCKLYRPVVNLNGVSLAIYEELLSILKSGFYINSSIIEQKGET